MITMYNFKLRDLSTNLLLSINYSIIAIIGYKLNGPSCLSI